MPDECTHQWHNDRCTRCDAVKPFTQPGSRWWAAAVVLLCSLASCASIDSRATNSKSIPVPGESSASPASCVAIDADLLDEPGPFEALSLWGQRSKFWPNQSTLKVRFLEGSATQQAQAWARFQAIDRLAGITFTRVTSGPSDIRVAFRPGGGHWSYLGTDCRTIPPNAPTMNLSLSRWETAQEWDRVALHEVLHALGFNHEQAHPHHAIPWNVPRVLSDYAREQGWSEAQTRRQVIARADGADFVGSAYDPASIMHYPIPRAHVTDPKAAVGWNTRLTVTDERIIGEIYPPTP